LINDRIELLDTGILERQAANIEIIKQKSAEFNIGIGWHYWLDLAWVLEHLGGVENKRILDAGAGHGILQFMLAEQGAEIISVDLNSRRNLSMRYRKKFDIRGAATDDLNSPWQVAMSRLQDATFGSFRERIVASGKALAGGVAAAMAGKGSGRIILLHEDLGNLTFVADESVDAIVSVSSLEHNDPENLTHIVAELMRVLKPGGLLLATVPGAKEKDWFHEPSHGWCYTADSLQRLFGIPDGYETNYTDFDPIFSGVKESQYLQDNLAPLYKESGDNGMPWGIWDPQYPPAAVLKVKR